MLSPAARRCCRHHPPQDDKGVSNWSHIGGFVTAFALATVFLPRMEGAVRVPRALWFAIVAVCLGAIFFSFLVLPLNFYGLCVTTVESRDVTALSPYDPLGTVAQLRPPRLQNPAI